MQEIHLPMPHLAQQRIVDEARRYNVAACGRRFGKTKLGIDRIIWPMLSGQPVGWFAPTYKVMIDAWQEICEVLEPITMRSHAGDHRLELATKGVLEMWTLQDANAGRSRWYKRIIVDEAAMVADLMPIWNAALRPLLVDAAGDAWFFSTPKGRNGFWQMWTQGQDEAYPEWMSWQMPTSANPYIDKEEIERMRREMPARIFAQEILAQFLEDAGGVFRGVVDAATAHEQDAALPGHEYVIGVDWAKIEDFTVFAVGDITTQEIVHLERFNQVDYRVQRRYLEALDQRFRPTVIIAERNSIGEPNIEDLQMHGLPVRGFTTTNATKAHAIESLQLGVETGSLKIINDPVLINELQAYEMERLPSGRVRYNAPPGMHDDTVIATALAWHGMALSQPVEVEAGTIALW